MGNVKPSKSIADLLSYPLKDVQLKPVERPLPVNQSLQESKVQETPNYKKPGRQIKLDKIQ